MLIKYSLLVFIGLSGGITIAGAVFTFITKIGLVTRLASRTNTARHILFFEDCVTLGGTVGNLMTIWRFEVPFGIIGITVFGLFAGMFTGCLAMALTEVLDTIPIFAKRINLRKGIPFAVLSLAIGKGIGSFIQLYIFAK
ncbi:stage V sporulation protein AB [Mobilisporobacter senegalensis]|uniref:Stage V sporulation protein AB n=1 Tax=Mobilisporobacter senegalensis TaxID=1329262 RepID=A0A3N1XKS0_9FIRM|nr:stage V sporulation protein AB [Mobilisporobacter senegalensis]ROR27310.1 stage V sporulation protein AB [Mobilisporobacter senegalensis]